MYLYEMKEVWFVFLTGCQMKQILQRQCVPLIWTIVLYSVNLLTVDTYNKAF